LLQLSLDNSEKAYRKSKKRLHKRNESGTVIVINPTENYEIKSKWDITKRFDQEYKIN
jgi:predicted patatin/cPLA2 family phospholipase